MYTPLKDSCCLFIFQRLFNQFLELIHLNRIDDVLQRFAVENRGNVFYGEPYSMIRDPILRA